MTLAARVSALTTALLAVGIACFPAPAAQAAGSRVRATQRLVVLEHDHAVRARPSRHARTIEWLGARRPLTGVRTVLPVLGRTLAPGGQAWVHVRLPGRPNSHAGWTSRPAG